MQLALQITNKDVCDVLQRFGLAPELNVLLVCALETYNIGIKLSKSRRSRILNFKLLQSPSQRRSNQKRLIRRSLFQRLIIHRPPPHRRRTACVARCVIIRLLKTRRRKLPRACEGRCAQAGEGSQPIPRPHVPQRLGRIGQPLCRQMPPEVRSSRANPRCSVVDPMRVTVVSSAAGPGAAVAWG